MGNIQKRENGQWRARYRDPSGRERARHFDRKIDAERWLVAIESTKHRGEWVDPAMSRITVGDWSTRWLQGQSSAEAPDPTPLSQHHAGSDPAGVGAGSPLRDHSR